MTDEAKPDRETKPWKGMGIYQAQTQIMKWLRSIGHRTIENDLQMRGCTSKRRYASIAEAHAAFPLMRRYKCKYCDGWHVTSR